MSKMGCGSQKIPLFDGFYPRCAEALRMTLGVSELLAQVAFDLTGTGVSWGHGPPRMSHFFGDLPVPKSEGQLGAKNREVNNLEP